MDVLSDDKSGYDQWVDRSYLEISTPSIDWDTWFDAINFTSVGLESDDENAPVDDMGQPYDIPRLIVAKGDFPDTIEDILSCKVIYLGCQSLYTHIRIAW
jgi:hypothetical protein